MYESMVSSEPSPVPAIRRVKHPWTVAILLILLVGAAAYLGWKAFWPGSGPAEGGIISTSELAERYGLGVRLIGVTAGGGLLDLRLKILDVDKARGFLQDPANLPISIVTENGTELHAADTVEDDVTWEVGGILFILLPNSGGVVKPGAPVQVEFGSMQVEPIVAQ